MNKLLIYVLICIFLISSVCAFPSVINRVGTEDSKYNVLIKQIPKDYLDGLYVFEIVNYYPKNTCGLFTGSYFQDGVLIKPKIVLSDRWFCVKDESYMKWVLMHEVGHFVILRDTKVLSTEYEANDWEEKHKL